jgi:hypothetical protein
MASFCSAFFADDASQLLGSPSQMCEVRLNSNDMIGCPVYRMVLWDPLSNGCAWKSIEPVKPKLPRISGIKYLHTFHMYGPASSLEIAA